MTGAAPPSARCPPISDLCAGPPALLCFAGLVAMRGAQNPIPFRTRPLNPSAPMGTASQGAGEGRRQACQAQNEPTNLRHTRHSSPHGAGTRFRSNTRRRSPSPAGWSSPVARQAHNLKVAGSNPAPATKITQVSQYLMGRPRGAALSFSTPVLTVRTTARTHCTGRAQRSHVGGSSAFINSRSEARRCMTGVGRRTNPLRGRARVVTAGRDTTLRLR